MVLELEQRPKEAQGRKVAEALLPALKAPHQQPVLRPAKDLEEQVDQRREAQQLLQRGDDKVLEAFGLGVLTTKQAVSRTVAEVP